jgi:hypothetical protein
VLADNLSEAAIIEAVRRGRTIVQLRGPDDPLLDVTLRSSAGGSAEIGDDVFGVSRARLAIHVTGGDGMFAQVWRNGAMVEPEVPVVGDDFSTTIEDVPGAGDFRYRVQLVNGSGQLIVITSHFYVHALEGGSGGCGCDAHTGVAGGVVPVLLMLVPARVRRRRRR